MEFLDRASGPFFDRVRETLEDWLSRYPEADRHELVARMRARDGSFMAERVEEFERVRRDTSTLRDLQTEVAEREARLRDIRAEQQLRGRSAEGLALHVDRLTRF